MGETVRSKPRTMMCELMGHVRSWLTWWIDRGLTVEGVDGWGCSRCGKPLP